MVEYKGFSLVSTAQSNTYTRQLIVRQESSWVPTSSGTLQGQQSSQAAGFRLVLPPELVLPLHSCVDSCTQTLHYGLPGDHFLNELINVMNFVLAQKVKTPIPATGRNSHSNSVHNSPGTLSLSHSSSFACFQVPLFKIMLLEQYLSLLSRSGFPPFRLLTALDRDVFHRKYRKVLPLFHCVFSLDCFPPNQDPVGDLEVTNLAVISATVLVSLPICNFMTKSIFFLPILHVMFLLNC